MTNTYAWDAGKNKKLIAERGFGFGFGFEDVVAEIELSGALDDVNHPSPNYPHQRMLFVAMNNYAVAVPYVMNGDTKFLKTAFLSRRATRMYLNG